MAFMFDRVGNGTVVQMIEIVRTRKGKLCTISSRFRAHPSIYGLSNCSLLDVINRLDIPYPRGALYNCKGK